MLKCQSQSGLFSGDVDLIAIAVANYSQFLAQVEIILYHVGIGLSNLSWHVGTIG